MKHQGRLIKFLAPLFALPSLLSAAPEIVGYEPGILMFEGDGPGLYRIEWAPAPGEPYRSDWSDLSSIVSTSGVEAVEVPMLFRVVEAASSTNFPTAVTDQDFYDDGAPLPAKSELGRILFFDKEISGNRNISCATCHHSLTGTGDGLSLPIGEGGQGLGVARNTGIGADVVVERVPRNAPPVFNLGAREFTDLFHDGRVVTNAAFPSGIETPAANLLPTTMENPLAAQAMFPVTSGTEMAGQAGENDIANFAAAGDLVSIWNALALRLQAIPEYVTMFQAAFPAVITATDITFAHAANAIAAFEATSWRADHSPFDRFLRGEKGTMSPEQLRGMGLFYGKANCASCHSGKFQTDLKYYAIGIPQIGGGKGNGASGHDDFGRENVTGDEADRYKFRTSTLRNIALTPPYGHDGAYNTLDAVVRHHLDPVNSLNNYDSTQLVMPSRPDLDATDLFIHNDASSRVALVLAIELAPLSLTETEIDELTAFLHALTDLSSLDLRADVPGTVPSGLPVFD